ncbi:MAG: ECF transporter S component [Candidatus Thorarchaeota archaeon]
MREKLRVQHWTVALMTIITGLVGAAIFALVHAIPMPYTMISLLKFGISPALAIIALIGGVRGPLAGFLAGYFGIVIYDLISFNTVVILTLPAMAYGVLGLVVGLASYDFSNGRSLGKLSILSAIGLVFTAILLVVIGLFIGNSSVLAELGLVMLPLLTMGLPSVTLLTPILARVWLVISQIVQLPYRSI